MMVLRVMGVWSLLVAMVALTIDGTKSLASGDGQWIVTPLAEHWQRVNGASLNAAREAVQQTVLPALWDPVIVTLLQVPTWMLFGALGILLYWFGRRRRRLNVYGN